MQAYNDILNGIIRDGDSVDSRAGPVLRLSHEFFMHDLRNGFPAITGRKLAFNAMAAELACFVKGLRDVQDFKDRGCNIWDKDLARFNAEQNMPGNTDLGPVYGVQWRNFGGVDQLRQVIDTAKTDPGSRRLLVSAWNPPEIKDMVLPPCHVMFQISIVNQHLDLIFYMRSVDMALGFPFDIASYGLLTHLIANELGLTPRWLTAVLADCHLYKANLAGIEAYLKAKTFPLPQLVLDVLPGMPVEQFEPGMAALSNYSHSPAIKMEMQT